MGSRTLTDYPSALENLRLAVVRLPDVALVHYHLGRAYAALGKNDDAQEEFDVATKRLPEGDPLHALIQQGNAELRTGITHLHCRQ